MSILNSIFRNKKQEKKQAPSYIQWIPLTSLQQLQAIKELSIKEPVLIFKHSTRCSISSMVIKRFQASFTEETQHLKVYYLDLLNYRAISDEVGYQFQVLHQSPQLLVIKNKEAVAAASHYGILELDITMLIK